MTEGGGRARGAGVALPGYCDGAGRFKWRGGNQKIAVTATSKAQKQGGTEMVNVTTRCTAQVAGWQSKGYCDGEGVEKYSGGHADSPRVVVTASEKAQERVGTPRVIMTSGYGSGGGVALHELL